MSMIAILSQVHALPVVDPHDGIKPSSRCYTSEIWGNHNSFTCQTGAYVKAINAIVTDSINSIQFECSAGKPSPYYGAKYDVANVKASAYKVYSKNGEPVRKSLAFESGFDNMMFDLSKDAVVGLKTTLNGVDFRILPDDEAISGAFAYNSWPTGADNSTSDLTKVISGFSVYDWGSKITTLCPQYRDVTSSTPAVTPVAPLRITGPVVLDNSSPNVEPEVGQVAFGEGGGDNDDSFKCNDPEAYVTSINSVVSDNMLNVQFECSKGSPSKCFGVCGQNYEAMAKAPYSGKDSSKYYKMGSQLGFNKLEAYANKRVSGLRSPNTVSSIMSDLPGDNNDWSYFPLEGALDDGKKFKGGPNGLIVVGFKINFDDESIRQLVPLYRARKQK